MNKSNLVESFPNGWGTVSSIDDKVNVISLFTEKLCSSLKELKDYGCWFDFLKQTSFLKKFLVDDSPRRIIFSDASSSILSKVSGDNWLAIGDAAMSFDPIASHGTSNALYCADLSSKVIESFLKDGSRDSILHYNTTLNKIFKEYLFQKTNLYKTENRWRDQQFWNNFQSVSYID